MRWSYRIARVAGIEIRVHTTFVLVLALGAMQWGAPHGASGAVFGVALTALLFLCVTLHELGHALAARAFGIPVKDIVLLPIGGVASLTRKPRLPWHELVIALAGPAVNVVLALGLAGVLAVLSGAGLVSPVDALAHPAALTPSLGVALAWLLASNVVLAVFNMIPALPMDGGRVLRALLAMVLEPSRATRTAARVAQVIAVLFGGAALYSGQLMLGAIAAFVFFAAAREHRAARASDVLATVKAGDAARVPHLIAYGDESAAYLARALRATNESTIAVTDGNSLLGVIRREALVDALRAGHDGLTAAELLSPALAYVPAHATLADVERLLQETGARVAAVTEGPALLGLVDVERLGEAYELAAGLARGRRRPAEA